MNARRRIFVIALAFTSVALIGAAAPTQISMAAEGGLRWGAFGDSYAAGEGLEHPSRDDLARYGADDTVDGSGETVRNCQRALAGDEYPSAAWGASLAETRSGPFAFVACTGAITDDLFPAPAGRLQAGQLEQARFFSGEERFDVVTLTLGGNNVGFGDIIMGCAGLSNQGATTLLTTGAAGWLNAPWVGCLISESELKARIAALTDTRSVQSSPSCDALGDNTSTTGIWDDDQLYRGKVTLPELFDVIGRCVAPGGTVVVMGYPQIIDKPGYWNRIEGNRCHRIRRADVGRLRAAGAYLNYKISQTANWASSRTGAEFIYVDPNGSWEGGERRERHALCGPGSDWLNGITVGTEGDGAYRKERSFHPNQLGHDAMAALAAEIQFGPARASSQATEQLTIDPFDAAGLRQGWSVDRTRMLSEPTECSAGYPSPYAIGPGTQACWDAGSSVVGLAACWPAPTTVSEVWCLAGEEGGPAERTLLASSVSGVDLSTPAPDIPDPVFLELADGSMWQRVEGGSWGGRADGLLTAYRCANTRGSCSPGSNQFVLVPPDSVAVDRASPTWRVRVGETGETDMSYPKMWVGVRRAWFVAGGRNTR